MLTVNFEWEWFGRYDYDDTPDTDLKIKMFISPQNHFHRESLPQRQDKQRWVIRFTHITTRTQTIITELNYWLLKASSTLEHDIPLQIIQ